MYYMAYCTVHVVERGAREEGEALVSRVPPPGWRAAMWHIEHACHALDVA